MTNDSKKRNGTLGRLIDAIVAWGNAMDYMHDDYVLDRLCNLEREVLLLRDELRALPALNNASDHAKSASSQTAVAR
jgi:hypothetical protein